MTRLVYATSNPGKIKEIRKHLKGHGLVVESMTDLGCADLEVPEPGTTLGENAVIKVCAYLAELQQQLHLKGERVVVLSDDTGMEIEGLNGEPGIHVRRWKDHETRMSDEEIISYALERMAGLAGDDRKAEFRTVLAAGVLNEDGTTTEPLLFEGTLRGTILEKTGSNRVEGFPFASLFFVDEYGMLLGDFEALPFEEKGDRANHRERAVNNSLSFVREQMDA